VPTLDDLRRVIRRIEGARPPRPAPETVESMLGGEVVETDAGAVLAVHHDVPLTTAYGPAALGEIAEIPRATLALLAPAVGDGVDPRGLLFLDTETTGLAGGTGTYAFLVGVARLDGARLRVTQLFMRDLDEEPALIAALAPLLAGATAIVSFNGSGFDVPLLETRFILQRKRWPAALPHVDLMRPARRVWGDWLEDCRLATLEQRVLRVVRERDVPGSVIPSLYFQFLRRRIAAPLRDVLAHNRYDVLALAGLLGWLARAVRGNVRLGPEEHAGLGRLWEPADVERACACYEAALSAGLDGAFAHAVRLRLARWEKRRARWAAARVLWEAATAATAFDPRPWEELAKFHEHRARDLSAARAVVLRALDLARAAAPRDHQGGSRPIVEAFAHRLARLERRLAT
jgi:uncharacterized protein YprB with RNaseH-like and TPR domain